MRLRQESRRTPHSFDEIMPSMCCGRREDDSSFHASNHRRIETVDKPTARQIIQRNEMHSHYVEAHWTLLCGRCECGLTIRHQMFDFAPWETALDSFLRSALRFTTLYIRVLGIRCSQLRTSKHFNIGNLCSQTAEHSTRQHFFCHCVSHGT